MFKNEKLLFSFQSKPPHFFHKIFSIFNLNNRVKILSVDKEIKKACIYIYIYILLLSLNFKGRDYEKLFYSWGILKYLNRNGK